MSDQIEVEDTFTVTFADGETQKILMSFGLMNKLASFVQSLDQVSFIFSDFSLREAVLLECLAIRDLEGDAQENADLMNEQLSVNEALNLLEWVVKHLTNFFTMALMKSMALTAQVTQNLNSQSTQAGTKD